MVTKSEAQSRCALLQRYARDGEITGYYKPVPSERKATFFDLFRKRITEEVADLGKEGLFITLPGNDILRITNPEMAKHLAHKNGARLITLKEAYGTYNKALTEKATLYKNFTFYAVRDDGSIVREWLGINGVGDVEDMNTSPGKPVDFVACIKLGALEEEKRTEGEVVSLAKELLRDKYRMERERRTVLALEMERNANHAEEPKRQYRSSWDWDFSSTTSPFWWM